MTDTTTKPTDVTVRFYNWEGDAGRIHTHVDGTMKADLYRGGKGVIPIDATDLLFDGKEISEDMYKELVLEEIALRKRKGQE